MKKFNVTGTCIPNEDYMADVSNKIEKIASMVEQRQYFIINRARQYGKTTTLTLLEKALEDRYIVAFISFKGVGEVSFETEENFCKFFLKSISNALEFTKMNKEYIKSWVNESVIAIEVLGCHITNMCKNNKVILLIDEVDKASNYKVFIEFLGMLRRKFLNRKNNKDYTFHSVILAGVHDIKNIKGKMIREEKYISFEGEVSFNSPWNIAASFNIDMSFNSYEIASMLNEYEEDHGTGMNIEAISNEIHNYTSGYPFLVSRICQIIDEDLDKEWTVSSVQQAVKFILDEKNTLFDDISKNLENNSELYDFIYDLLVVGETKTFSPDNPLISFGIMYGYLMNYERKVMIFNRIFEIRLMNYFISKDDNNKRKKITGVLQYDIIHNGKFNMELCLRKFAEYYKEIYNYNNNDTAFLERHGRMIFLSYLKPLINGQGFYHIESQFTDLRRMDVVVDYGNEQFIVELKIWYGDSEHQKAYKQLSGYLAHKRFEKGYLLTFDFRKNVNKEIKSEWVNIGDKYIFDVVV